MGHLVNHLAFRLGHNISTQIKTDNNTRGVMLIEHIRAFLTRFNIHIIKFYSEQNQNFYRLIFLLYFPLKFKKGKRRQPQFLKKKQNEYVKRSKRRAYSTMYFGRPLSKKFQLQVKHIRVQYNFIKNYKKLFQLKLLLEQHAYHNLLTPIKIEFSNVWRWIPNKDKFHYKRILRTLRFYKKIKILKTLIMTCGICFRCKQINFFNHYFATIFARTQKHWPTINALKAVVREFMRLRFGVKGFQIVITGRVAGKARAKKHMIKLGQIAISTITHNISYSCYHSYSPFGVFGIKMWLVY